MATVAALVAQDLVVASVQDLVAVSVVQVLVDPVALVDWEVLVDPEVLVDRAALVAMDHPTATEDSRFLIYS